MVVSRSGRSDICMGDLWDNGTVMPGRLFPNWTKVQVGSFDTLLCLSTYCPTPTVENILSVTVVNFGTAGNTDFKGVYFRANCGSPDTGLIAMTYAGNYKSDSGTWPAWTWAGTTASFAGCADLCGKAACGAFFTIDVYVDVDDCPTEGATVAMGFPTTAETNSWSHWGSIWDSAGCETPQYDVVGPEKVIAYIFKEGSPDIVAPGDTVDYTVYYGRPGINNLSSIVIIDSQPPYTHYVDGSASPPPDSGWDPNIGPPLKLKWTIPGVLAVAGGPTNKVSFKLTVDWGNGDSFEPGSGDTAAPEGYRLLNSAQAFFNGGSCSPPTNISLPTDTVVRRFLMWMVGDNDILFAPSFGQPADEMIYSIFIRNVSTTKTWWQVSVWDTVPAQLDVWSPGFGIEDSCVGWTMTPTGCAVANAGLKLSGTNTILTWKLDMAPSMTLELRWKSRVMPNASVGDTAVNMLNVLAYGRTGMVEGTGYSGVPKRFAHLAPIVLATTYVGYLGFACSQNCNDAGYMVDFFPLNRKTQFELRALFYNGAGYANAGGVSGSLGTLIGNCLIGFPGGGGIPGGGQAGCKAERIPAWYSACTAGGCAYSTTEPLHHIFKLVSNAPVAWQLLSGLPGSPFDGQSHCGDYGTNAPSTTLTYIGLMHYMFREWCSNGPATPGYGSALNLINTGKDPFGAINTDMSTSVHLFRFNYGTLGWEYQRTYELGPEGAAFDDHTYTAEAGPWRTISSEGQLAVIETFQFSNKIGCCCGCCGHNAATFGPNRESGNYVGTGSFYNYVYGPSDPTKSVITNVGAASAHIEIARYVPTSFTGLVPGVPSQLEGTSGSWKTVSSFDLPAGFANAKNPAIFDQDGPAYNASSFALVRTRCTSGGPIQVVAGERVFSIWGSGGQIHAITGSTMGTEFWLSPIQANNGVGGTCGMTPTQTVNVYCPKAGMIIQAQSETGAYSATYTTTLSDQVVSYTGIPEPATKMNYKFKVLGPAGATALTQYLQCGWERGYSAPFLVTGTHYEIITPPVVFLGQSFWITIIVMDSGGGTKTNYNGTTSFTSTDPKATIQGSGMDSYNYTWVPAGDQGVKIFFNVVFTQMGFQTIVAQDVLDGSISGVASFQVVGADVKIEKRNKLTVAASGDTVRFQICWSNYSTATAYSFTITDAIPRGTDYYPEDPANAICGQNGPATASVTMAAGGASGTTPPAAMTTYNPGTPPPSTSRWLRWTVSHAYVSATGCICFKVLVN